MVRTEIYKVELDAWRVARSWLIKTLNSVPSPNLCLCSIPGKDALLHPNMKSYCSLTPHLPSKAWSHPCSLWHLCTPKLAVCEIPPSLTKSLKQKPLPRDSNLLHFKLSDDENILKLDIGDDCCCCYVASVVRLCATPWTSAYQAPPPMGFSKQEF